MSIQACRDMKSQRLKILNGKTAQIYFLPALRVFMVKPIELTTS